ncbi:MAG TPA: tetratricopeptide repeat protein [Polyangiaceae bacterium]|nr:tetratricopeptide repeat protein [Polyangiaceae bacterium]
MDRRVPHPLLLTGLAAFVILIASHALAAPKDNAALKLDDDAIFNDYLATKFTDAERKLKQAVTLCGRTGCSPSVLAQVRRDLGIVYVVTGRTDEARAQFGEALRLDPATSLPKDLATPEIQQVFASAGGSGGGGGRSASLPPVEAAPEKGPVTAAPAGPDEEEEIEHIPVGEAALWTPLVIFAEMAPGINPSKVQVRYKAFGSPDWKRLELKKYRRGYGAEIACTDIGSTPGEMRYYVQALGPSGEVIATNGTRSAPHRVILKDDPADEPRHLPGKPIPEKCKGGMQVDCPPGLPGCASDRKKAPGAECGMDAECQAGVCLNGMCGGDPDKVQDIKCETDAECGTGKSCKEGACIGVAKKNWIGFAAQQDVLMLPSAMGVCSDPAEYVCFQSAEFYDPNVFQPIAEAGDEVKGGFAISTTRIMLSYDRTLGSHIGLGARVGYAFGGGPTAPEGKAFFPAHLEARISYWLGKNPFASTSVRPYLVLSGGVAQFDSKVKVQVYERNPDNPRQVDQYEVVAWKKAGTSFVQAGGGVLFPFDFKSGIIAEVKVMQAFSASALGANFQLGYQMGL